ncbi:MAG: hypothetical protein RLN59_02105 [Haliea sp.]
MLMRRSGVNAGSALNNDRLDPGGHYEGGDIIPGLSLVERSPSWVTGRAPLAGRPLRVAIASPGAIVYHAPPRERLPPAMCFWLA